MALHYYIGQRTSDASGAMCNAIEGGCTIGEIVAITDQNPAMFGHYSKGRNQAAIAKNTIAK